ncbi:MAG: S9 family peptidase [Acidobacteria bacterium]|nr:S9 family peptidase [Acidobacteriota bacterium]
MPPPRAPQRPHRHEKHGDVRVDDYHWLRERDNPEVKAYLEAENAYLREVASATAAFEERLFDEIKGRIEQTDMSAPYREGAYRYYRRYEEGREYEIHCRRPLAGAGAPRGAADDEQVILDVNRVAAGHEFCQVASRPVSPGGRLLAYAVDTVGRRQYAIRVRDLATGEERPDVIADVTSNIAWAADGEAFFYARHDPTTLRPYRILRHRLGDDPSDDRLVHEEIDDTFSCGVWLSRSKRYVLIGSFQTLTTEFRYLDAADPDASPRVLLPRERGHEYDIDHYRGRFYIRSNDGARNFRLLEADDGAPARDAWRELIPHRDDVLITGFELFRDHLVVAERHAGLTRLRVRRWDGPEHHIAFDEAAHAVSIGTNREPDTTTLRFHYSSLTTPPSVYDYDLHTRARTLLKREKVLGDFDPGRYETERLLATAPDGVRVPISLVRRKREVSGRGAPEEAAGMPADPSRATDDAGPAPLLLYGYGAYGISMEPTFRSARLSLLDRGFTYAIAHVRGGEELGRRWYDDGKLRKKKNTFTDFIACAEHLVAEGHATPESLFAMGGSAGGLLMGAVVNLRPDLFHGVVAQVPFVDVVTTMLDESIPLTTGEYDEWGNPNRAGDYAYIRSYSPYDNMEPVTWPHLLVMTGLHDSQVQYWEPAKWVARRRTLQPGDGRRLLLKTNMDAGHGGASGRFRQYRETALQYAFLLDLADRADRDSASS